MTLDLFLVSTSVALLVLSGILIALFFMLNKSLAALRETLQGLGGLNRMATALGKIGDDLEEGRRAVKGSVALLGQISAPWLGLLRLLRA